MVDAIHKIFSSKQLVTNQATLPKTAVIKWAPLGKSNKTSAELAECFLFC